MIETIQKLADRVGGIKKLAQSLGIRHQSIYSWRKVPAERVLDIERLTGISRHELRPDLFGPPPQIAKGGGEGGGGEAAGHDATLTTEPQAVSAKDEGSFASRRRLDEIERGDA